MPHRPRSPSPLPPPSKRPKISSDDSFMPSLFASAPLLAEEYRTSSPFKHCVVDKLFDDDLLKNVKDECLSELRFVEKETDIYKVNQTGDLASLEYLNEEQRSLLPSLLKLRNALYSKEFRAFLQRITGCGPLSGVKQDMSVNSYTKGCHLLNHDDVIGSRRVSYILYMPLPHYQGWQREWGGALELYPVGETGEPSSEPEKIIPPSWNQFVFFEVQPGKSFHSVQEVMVGERSGEDGRERVSISGWFHKAQLGEEDYQPERETYVEASREQLAKDDDKVFQEYPEGDMELNEADISFLSEYLNPVYLQPRTIQALAARFVEESSLDLHEFLLSSLSQALEPKLRDADSLAALGSERISRMPSHTAGIEDDAPWQVRGPPHRWRYCTLRPPSPGTPTTSITPLAAHPEPSSILRVLQDELFPSQEFRKWLIGVCGGIIPTGCHVESRRFRPGLDYTLASAVDNESRLDVVLGLTPSGGKGWEEAIWGGWECYLAPPSEEGDPAVVYSGSKPKDSNVEGAEDDEDVELSDTEEDDDTLLTVQPGFNRLLLVLRDERVMRFVKYVSAQAEGSRWDVCAEYAIGKLEEADE